ncbi:MAG: phage head closure protein, partial [Bacteroidetes bacterium]|nr:phage head closure protein [Bacteroidota bacterium]
MQSGILKYKIEILTKSIIIDNNGIRKDVWSVEFSIRAGLIYRGGNKTIQDNQEFNTSNIELTIRNNKNITEANRVRFKDRIYKINAINRNPFDNSLILNCELMTGLYNDSVVNTFNFIKPTSLEVTGNGITFYLKIIFNENITFLGADNKPFNLLLNGDNLGYEFDEYTDNYINIYIEKN